MTLAAITTERRGQLSLDESFKFCRTLSRRTARNFYFSFLTLPADRRRDMCALYAFMRVTDDHSDDESRPITERVRLLNAWRAGLSTALADDASDHPVLHALVDVVRRHKIPYEHLFAVLDGVAADLAPVRYETFDDLSAYCYRVAGAVGLCCIHVWGFDGSAEAVARAVDCGNAFQLTNILRDLAEDADRDRVYLPQEDLRRFDYTADDLLNRVKDKRFDALMQFETDRAADYYRRAQELFPHLESPGRPIYAAMLEIYGGLLDRIVETGYDVFTRRVRLSRTRKLWITLRSIIRYRCLNRSNL